MALPRHMPALDGLRGVAILMVVMTHVNQGWWGAMAVYAEPLAGQPTFALPEWLDGVMVGGAHGVQLFFVVSAFTLALRVGPRTDLVGYARRRLARVGPGYWLAGAGYLVLGGTGPHLWAPDGIEVADVAVAAAFGSPWQQGAAMAVVPGGWSVCCEVAFYLSLPLLSHLSGGRTWRAAALTGAACLVAQACIMAGRDLGAFDPVQELPVFLCGVTAALAMRDRVGPLPGWPLAPLLALVFAAPLLPAPGSFVIGQVLMGGVLACIVALAAVAAPGLLAGRVMVGLGQVSYSMYLLHFAVLAPSLWLASRLVPAADWRTAIVHFILTTGISFALACVTFRYVEQPCIRWAARASRRAPAFSA